ncbi:hypothetical protein ACHWQZ_G014414 [Mnemiopsis leidyi]
MDWIVSTFKVKAFPRAGLVTCNKHVTVSTDQAEIESCATPTDASLLLLRQLVQTLIVTSPCSYSYKAHVKRLTRTGGLSVLHFK